MQLLILELSEAFVNILHDSKEPDCSFDGIHRFRSVVLKSEKLPFVSRFGTKHLEKSEYFVMI